MKLRMFLSVALFGLFSMSASAQSFGDLLKKVTSGTSALSTAKDYVVSLLGTDKVTAADLSGTWSYSEPAVVFESENVVSKLGGAALAQSTEKQLASLLEKIGLEAGKIQLTFNDEGSLTVIPVVSDPIDIINPYTPPTIFDDGWSWWLIVILGVTAVGCVVGIVFTSRAHRRSNKTEQEENEGGNG